MCEADATQPPFFIYPLDMASVLITGGTGYMGRALIPELLRRSHQVHALVRPGSEKKLPAGATSIRGDALDAASVRQAIPGCDTLVHLVGVAHPGPAKATQFLTIDLVSIEASVAAARDSAIRHFVYVSVAHPAPVMKDFIAVRRKGECLIREAEFIATILRPWYVLGPGHRWPYVLIPIYRIMEHLSATRDAAIRLGLVNLRQMVAALVDAVEHPPAAIRIVEPREIRMARI